MWNCDDRNNRIIGMRNSGMTLREISQEIGISAERVRQILQCCVQDAQGNKYISAIRTHPGISETRLGRILLYSDLSASENLRTRAYNALFRAGIQTVENFMAEDMETFRSIRTVGEKTAAVYKEMREQIKNGEIRECP